MAGPIRIAILANGRQARSEAALTARAYGGLGRTLGKLGAAAGLTALTAKAVGFAASSVKLEAQYSQTMATIQSATGASERAMSKLNQQALKLGADTSFSASDAADAMLELAKAGVKTRDIMGGGVAGTLQLAADGGTELGTAATIASNAMNSFNLGGKKMASIAAALAGGANASSASVESLGMGLAQVGAGAVNAGLNLQETVAALAAFDNAGVKGSDAGTSLKTMLARLVPQTDKAREAMHELGLDFTNSRGEFVSLTQISERLKKHLGNLTAEQRTTALATIFGSDATRAASILMRQGADGIRKYIKATNDQGAAQKMAEARMSGTAGSLERLSGAVETAQLRLGQELAPAVQTVSDKLADNAVPAMEATIDAGKLLGGALEPAARALVVLAKAGADTAQFIGGLPDPVKEIGIQAGLAALVLPRLSAGVTSVTSTVTANIARLQQWRAEMTYSATRAQGVASAMQRLSGAAKAAAGVGGLVALTHATQETNEGLRSLEFVAAGALAGFSVGGPIGAGVGALAGAIGAVATATDHAGDSLQFAKPQVESFAGALDQVSGAATRAANDVARLSLQQSGAFESGRLLGITSRDLVQATLGHEGAVKRVTSALNGAERQQVRWANSIGIAAGSYNALGPAIAVVENALGATTAQFEKDQAAARQAAIANGDFARALDGISAKARRGITTRIDMRGWPEGERQIARVIRGLVDVGNKKQIRTVLRTLGAKESVADIQRVLRQLDNAGKKRAQAKIEVNTKGARADLTNWERGLTRALTDGRRAADRGAEGVAKALRTGTAKAKPDLSRFNSGITTSLGPAKANATSGGNQVGANLKAGVIAGFSGTASALAAAAASAVRAAVAAAKAAGKVHSPSVVMRDEVGRPLGQGIAVGMRRAEPEIKAASFGIIQALVEGLSGTSSASPVDGAIGDIVSRIEQLYDDRLQRATTRLGNRSDALGAKLTAQFDATDKAIDRRERRAEAKARKTLKGKALDKALRGINNAADRQRDHADARQERAETALQKAQQLAERKLTRQNKAERRATLAIVRQFTPALQANANAQAAINAQLEDARNALSSLQQQHADYVAQVRDNVVSFGSVIGLGEGTGFGSLDQMLTQLRAKVAQAQQYSALIQSLTVAGLNQTTLQQLIDAGVQGGLGTAQAIASGGSAAIQELNNLTAQLTAIGTDLGTHTADTMYGAGIAAAQGLVNGLASQQQALAEQGRLLAIRLDQALAEATALIARNSRGHGQNIGGNLVAGLLDGLDGNKDAIDKAATRLGNALVKAVKKELGIRSPSRVFKGIGLNVVKGLDIGLNDTYVKRSGAQLASSLTKGFGTPALDAFGAGVGGAGSQTITIRLSAAEVDQLRRGREYQADIAAWQAAIT